jgi:hypothetical protein
VTEGEVELYSMDYKPYGAYSYYVNYTSDEVSDNTIEKDKEERNRSSMNRISIPEEFDWTKRFQDAMNMPLEQRGKELSQLSEEFVRIAREIGGKKYIPLELHRIWSYFAF